MEKYVAFRLEKELYKQLESEANENHSSISRLLRLILIDRYNNASEE